MNRDEALSHLEDSSTRWDVIVIGGGATGLGTAVEAASRGYRTLLLERADFAKATSSRSTKLIHGGFRYLKQGSVSLVRESLRERGRLLRNAPHLVHPLPFIVPNYLWWERIYYGLGLKCYDWMAGSLGIEASRRLTKNQVRDELPTLNPAGLRGGIRYFDGQFDDVRLAISMALTLVDLGGTAMNYMPVTELVKEQGKVTGVIAVDDESKKEFRLNARVVINATGIFTDEIRRMDQPDAPQMLTVSQGTHLVLPGSFLQGDTAMMVPRTADERILFAIPWHGRLLLGTTDVPRDRPEAEPKPLEEEISYLLEHAHHYLKPAPERADILSVFSGLRPLVRKPGNTRTSRLSRSHVLAVSDSGLVTITGGKWTTYRQMAEDTIDRAIEVGGLESTPSKTATLSLHGATDQPTSRPHWQGYGTDATQLEVLIQSDPNLGAPLHPDLPYTGAEIIWAARNECARTLEDALSRRTRALMLDARAAMEAAPRAATIMAPELGRDDAWQKAQQEAFYDVARHYVPNAK